MVGITQSDARAIASSLSAGHLCELVEEGIVEVMVGAGVDDAPQCVKKVVEARARWLAAAQRGERTILRADSQPVYLPLYYEWTTEEVKAVVRDAFGMEPNIEVGALCALGNQERAGGGGVIACCCRDSYCRL